MKIFSIFPYHFLCLFSLFMFSRRKNHIFSPGKKFLFPSSRSLSQTLYADRGWLDSLEVDEKKQEKEKWK